MELLVCFSCLLHCLMASPCQANAEQMLIKGYTQPKVTIQVAFSQPGKIKMLTVEQGQKISKGAKLAELETGGLGTSLKIAKARAEDDSEILKAQSALDVVQQRLKDLQELAQSGGASPEEIRRVEADCNVARAQLKSAKLEQRVQALDANRLEQELELRKINSPIDGFVTKIHHRTGEYVSAAEPQVVEIVQLDPLRIRFFVPSQLAEELEVGKPVPVILSRTNNRLSAEVREISPVINPVSDTVEVYVELRNPKLKLKAGLECLLDLAQSEKTKSDNSK